VVATVESMAEVTVQILQKSSGADGVERIGDFTLIHGLGAEGLTPFEQLLEGKRPGDRIEQVVNRNTGQQFFGHHWWDVYAILNTRLQPVSVPLVFAVAAIRQVEPREIVKQLARIGGHGGCGGSCGCGCS
jgi:hypothetical protein